MSFLYNNATYKYILCIKNKLINIFIFYRNSCFNMQKILNLISLILKRNKDHFFCVPKLFTVTKELFLLSYINSSDIDFYIMYLVFVKKYFLFYTIICMTYCNVDIHIYIQY